MSEISPLVSSDVNADARAVESQEERLLTDLYSMKQKYYDTLTEIIANKKFTFASDKTAGYAPRFVKASKIGLRVASWCFITGGCVWLLKRNHLLSPTYEAALPSLVVAVIFNVCPTFAGTLKNAAQAFLGSLMAIAGSYALYQMPDSWHDTHLPAAPFAPDIGQCAADAHIDNHLKQWFCEASTGLVTADSAMPGLATFVAFIWYTGFALVALSLDTVLGFKVYAILNATTYMMNFANPAVDTSGYMDLQLDGVVVSGLVVQTIGSIIALIAVLVPPSTATRSSKVLAAKATKVVTELLVNLNNYYCGAHKSMEINVWNSILERNRTDMSDEATDLDLSWWEHFDWGCCRDRGVVRLLMSDHLSMLKDLDRRLTVVQNCVQREGFEQSHTTIMTEITPSLQVLVRTTGDVLMHCVIAAADGRFDHTELSSLRRERDAVQNASKHLLTNFRNARRKVLESGSDKSSGLLNRQIRTESFYVLEMRNIAKSVIDFINELETLPVPTNVALSSCKLFDWAKLKDFHGDFSNFVMRNVVSLTIAWWWACVFQNFSTSVPVNVVFMLTMVPGNALMASLGKIQALVLGSLGGMALYQMFHYCRPIYKFLKYAVLFFWEFLSIFIMNYTTEFSNVGMLLGVYGGSKLIMACTDTMTNGSVAMMQAAEYVSLKDFCYSMCIVTFVDFAMKPKPACDQARALLEEAMKTVHELTLCFLTDTWEDEDGEEVCFPYGEEEVTKLVGEKTDAVEAKLSEALALLGSCETEPRFYKGPFKSALFQDLVKYTRQIQHSVQVLVRRCQAVDDEADALLPVLQSTSSWRSLSEDIKITLKDATETSMRIMSYDGFGAMDTSDPDFKRVIQQEGIFDLQGVDVITRDLASKAPYNGAEQDDSPNPMASDKVSRMCAVIDMLEKVNKLAAEMMASAVKTM